MHCGPARLVRKQDPVLASVMRRLLIFCLLVAAATACGGPVAPTAAPLTPTGAAAALPPTGTPLVSLPPAATPTPTLQTSSVVLTGHSAPVTAVAWSPNGRLLATTAGDWDSPDPTIRLWRADGTLIKVLQGHTAAVRSLAWSPDGQLLASGSIDSTVRIWASDGSLVSTLQAPEPVVTVAWSPDGQVLAWASAPTMNPVVQLWRRDGTRLAALATQYTGGKFYNLAWSPDGRFLLGGAIDYKLWRADGSELFHLARCSNCTPAWAAAWSPDSTSWAIGNESGEVDVFDVQGHQIAHVQNSHGNADALAWSPDGKLLAGGDGVNFWQKDGSPQVSHASFGRVSGVAWSPGGDLLVSTSPTAGLRLWDAGGQLLAAFPGSVVAVAWSSDGHFLSAGFAEAHTLRLVQLTRPRYLP